MSQPIFYRAANEFKKLGFRSFNPASIAILPRVPYKY